MTFPNHTEKTPAKKPALVITRFPYESSWGGEESHTMNLARYFKEKGHEVIFMGSCKVLLNKFAEEGFPTQKAWAGKMIVTPWEMLKSFFFFPFYKRSLKKSFRKLRQKYEVGCLYCLSLNEKLFLTEEALRHEVSVTWVEHQEIRNWLSKNIWRKKYSRLGSMVDIVPISKKNETLLTSELHIPAERMHFIINGIHIEKELHPAKKSMNTIVFANRLIPKKGVMDFLQSLKENKEFFENKKISVIGEGEEREFAEQFVKKYLNDFDISFHNYLKNENWKELLESTDVFVSCARDHNETFSLNTAEALSKGCKVVVTKCSGIADFLVDKKEAFLCNPSDSEDLFKKIKEAFEAPQSLREMAKNAAKRKFNRDIMLEQYYTLITHHE